MVLTVLYHVLNFGWLAALSYYLFGAILCATIIFIPIGLSMFKIGKWHFSPFSNRIIKKKKLASMLNENEAKKWWHVLIPIANVLWAILFGWWLVAVQFVFSVACCASIVGIPMGIAQFRLLGTLFAPFGITIIREEEFKALQNHNSEIMKKIQNNA